MNFFEDSELDRSNRNGAHRKLSHSDLKEAGRRLEQEAKARSTLVRKSINLSRLIHYTLLKLSPSRMQSASSAECGNTLTSQTKLYYLTKKIFSRGNSFLREDSTLLRSSDEMESADNKPINTNYRVASTLAMRIAADARTSANCDTVASSLGSGTPEDNIGLSVSLK